MLQKQLVDMLRFEDSSLSMLNSFLVHPHFACFHGLAKIWELVQFVGQRLGPS